MFRTLELLGGLSLVTDIGTVLATTVVTARRMETEGPAATCEVARVASHGLELPRDGTGRVVAPSRHRGGRGLAVADLAYFTATGVAIYTLPLWVTGPVGSDMSSAGLAFGTFAVAALFLRPLAGRLADTRGRRPLLVGAASVTAVCSWTWV